jgi:hypothetical protein
MPEVDLEACKVMSGFIKTETRFAPSEHIVFPNDHNKYVKTCLGIMIPHYDTYVQEVNQLKRENKDCICAENFVCKIIPFLVETALKRWLLVFTSTSSPSIQCRIARNANVSPTGTILSKRS